MQHFTISGKFATAQLAIADVRENQLPKRKPIADRFPVVVATQFSPNKINYGIQYWTAAMIEEKESVNVDKTVSKLV